ncbi:STAS domain-containing protein [Blastomonas sp.]|uniref:STAS domain-containing protein n=1 Tax=Blastomonas sp. TaxID=1909299 RepID=UPI003594182B
MQWTSTERQGCVVASPDGRVDEATAEAFAEHLTSSVALAQASPNAKLVVDLADLDYMSSRGLRAITLAKRQADAVGVTMSLARPNAVMREILAISRYDKLFVVTDSIDEAL